MRGAWLAAVSRLQVKPCHLLHCLHTDRSPSIAVLLSFVCLADACLPAVPAPVPAVPADQLPAGCFSQGRAPATSMLLRNYRSHRRLLDLPSRMFYQGSLVAAADQRAGEGRPGGAVAGGTWGGRRQFGGGGTPGC